jgi:PAS domain S-box-containing protein
MKNKPKTKGELLAEISRLRKRVKKGRTVAVKNIKPILSPFSELHNLFLNSINDEIFVCEYQTKGEKPFKFLEVNSVACSRLGYSREELLQKSLYDIYVPETISQVEELMKKLKTQKYSVWEGTHLTKNGSRIPVEVSSHMLKSNGRLTVISAVKDITTRKQVEEAQKQTEQAIRESEHRFRTLAEASFEGIALTENGIIVDLNDQLAKMYDYKRGELIGKPFLDIIVSAFRTRVTEASQLDKRESYEILGLRKNGTIFPAEIRGRTVQMSGKELHISTIRDITERKQIEEALMNEKAFLDALMDNIPDSIYFKDRQCRITRANRKEMQDLHITDMSLIIGKTDEDLFGGEFGRRTTVSEQKLMESGEPVIGLVETRNLEDGQLNWTSTTKVPLRNKNGDIVGLVGITREINELMKAQEEREHERTLLRTLIDNLPDYIYIKDTIGRFIVGNNAVVRSFGFSSEENLIGKTDYDLFPEKIADQYRIFEQEIIQSGKGIYDFEGPAIDPSKKEKERWVSTTKVPLWGAQGKVIGTMGIGRDITERKRMEEALRETADKFRFIFENAYDGISIFEETYDRKQRRLIDCNKRYAEMAGRSREELLQVGTTIDIAKPLSEDHHESNKENVVFSGSFSWIRPDGKDNVIEYAAVPIKVQGKTITIGIDRDITERKRIEEERERLIKDLQQALTDVKTLSGLLPICANCKQIRDDKGFWMQVELYIQEHSQAQFSHGICPDCMKKLYPNILLGEND